MLEVRMTSSKKKKKTQQRRGVLFFPLRINAAGVRDGFDVGYVATIAKTTLKLSGEPVGMRRYLVIGE